MTSLAIADQPDPYAKLPALAERLGIQPVQAGASASVVISVKDGRAYDLFDIINALLDHVDKRNA